MSAWIPPSAGPATLPEMYARQVAQTPDACALSSAGGSLTYTQLDRRSTRLAQALQALGVGPGTPVGLCSTRSCALLVGLLGILKAGGAYVPLDPDYPRARRRQLQTDADVQIVVLEAGLSDEDAAPGSVILPIPTAQDSAAPAPLRASARADDPAYILYTSGSTGTPKGVVVTHANVLGLLAAMHAVVVVGPGDVLALAHSFAFDVSVYEIWSALSTGATLWIPTAEVLRSPCDWHGAVYAAGVTVLTQTPTAFRMLLLAEERVPAPPRLERLRCVLFAGERLEFRLLAPWIARYGVSQPRLVNLLGPTETTVHATAYVLQAADAAQPRSLIGWPLAGVQVAVLDAQQQPVPRGMTGELALTGWGVTRGYLHQPALTAARFRTLPCEGDTARIWYLTGDQVRQDAAGCLEFMGRTDTQIKLRGHRIELGEIEVCLRAHPAVADAVVLLEQAGTEQARLVAFVVPRAGGPTVPATALAAHVAARLPAVMRPAQYLDVTVLPRTVNGKLDQAALRATIPPAPRGVAAEDDLEAWVAGLFRTLLRVDTLDLRASFFELGGHSLLAARLLLALEQRLGVLLGVRDLLAAPDVLRLCARLRRHPSTRAVTPVHPRVAMANSLDQLLARQAERTPEATALRAPDGDYRYAALACAANRMAHALRARGVIPGSRVALALPRSADYVIAVLATLQCQATCVPIDPTQPRERRRALLHDADVALWVRDGDAGDCAGASAAAVFDLAHERDGLAAHPSVPLGLAPDADRVAYLLYTSGTTAAPNGVECTHHTILELLAGHPFPPQPGTVLQWAATGFDVSWQELFYAFAHGAALWMPDAATRLDPARLVHGLRVQQVTDVFMPNTALQLLVEAAQADGAPLPALQRLFQAGEPLIVTPALRAFCRRHPQCVLHNHYGPTETHVALAYTLTGDPTDWPTRPPIGRAVGRMGVAVWDPDGQPVRQGESGELVLWGPAVGLGYWHRPALSAARFTRHDGHRLYRTGDRARQRADGAYELEGRLDREVKLRGYRIALSDLESELAAHPQVRQCAVLCSDAASDPCLVAYVVLEGALDEPTRVLGDFLRARVTAAALPSAFVVLPTLPLTAHGKLDARALPQPLRTVPQLAAEDAPQSAAERAVAAAFADALGLGPLSRTAHFFALGGHSLSAVRLVARLSAQSGKALPVHALFAAPTIAGLAQALAEAPLQAPVAPVAPRAHATATGPLSAGQARLWFLRQTLGSPSAYNVVAALDLAGAVQARALQQALRALVQRHTILQTCYAWVEDGLVQRVDPTLRPAWQRTDLSARADTVRADALAAILRAAAQTPFDLSTGPVLRAHLVHVAAAHCRLVLSLHHIATDGWSMAVLWRELDLLYTAALRQEPVDWPPPRPYLAYVQHEQRLAPDASRSLGYWQRQLHGLPRLDLPLDRPRRARPSHHGDSVVVQLDGAMLQTLRRFVGRERTTLHTVLIATLQALLARYSGQTDFGIGLLHAGREDPRWEAVLGFFVNTVVLRSAAAAPTFRHHLQGVQETLLSALEHATVPFDAVLAATRADRAYDRHPLVDVLYTAQDFAAPVTHFAGLAAQPVAIPSSAAKFDLLLLATDLGTRVELRWEYATDLFDPRTIARMTQHFQNLLRAALAAPEAPWATLPWLAPAEMQQLLIAFNPPARALPAASVPALIAAQAALRPQAMAVRAVDAHLRYGALETCANRLAHALIAHGVCPGTVVAVSVPRDAQLVVTLLALWKAGAAYLPIDPTWPSARLHALLQAAGATLWLTDAAVCDPPPAAVVLRTRAALAGSVAQAPDHTPDIALGPELPAYLLQTSGSSGAPKLVEIPHRALVRLLHAPDYVQLGPDETIPFLSSLSFDASTFELWAPLVHGGQLVVAPSAGLDLDALGALLREHAVTTLWLTAALFNVVIDACPQLLAGVRQLLIGGEALSPAHVQRALDALPGVQLINGYGPTEVTTFACTYAIPRDGDRSLGPIPIGRPIGHTHALVLDAQQQLVPIGVPGELYLGGAGVARGYRGAPALTAARFVASPLAAGPGGRLFRTGDRVRWRADGCLEFLGRLDRQLKVRGHRIEPAEIEAVLLRHPTVRQAVVGLALEDNGAAILRACVVLAQAASADPAAESTLRQYLRAELPAYLVPDQLLCRSTLPRTLHGKLDLAALLHTAARATGATPPVSSTTAQLCALCSTLLGDTPVQPEDDFFVIGGHSLLAVQLLARVQAQFGRSVSLPAFLHDPSMAALARRVEDAPDAAGAAPVTAGLHVRGAPLTLRLVRRAHAAARGVLIGMPGVRGHAAELGYLAHHVLLDFDLYTFSLDGADAVAGTSASLSLTDPALFAETLAALVQALQAPEAPRASVLFGFSLGGFLAWQVEQALRRVGYPVTPVLNLDGPVLDQVHAAATPAWQALGARLRAQHTTPATPMLLVHRADTAERQLHPVRLVDRWRGEAVQLSTLPVPTLDHLDVAVTALLAPHDARLHQFIATGALPAYTETVASDVQSIGALAFALWHGRQDPAVLHALLRADLPADGHVRLGLLEAALQCGEVTGARDYAERLLAVEPHHRAAANVLLGLCQARGEFAAARALMRDWCYGPPVPVGLAFSARTPTPACAPASGVRVLGYRPSLDAAAAELRFPVCARIQHSASGLRGWAFDPHAPEQAVCLELRHGAQVLARVRADVPLAQSDPEAPAGAYGFALDWPVDVRLPPVHELHLRAVNDGTLYAIPGAQERA